MTAAYLTEPQKSTRTVTMGANGVPYLYGDKNRLHIKRSGVIPVSIVEFSRWHCGNLRKINTDLDHFMVSASLFTIAPLLHLQRQHKPGRKLIDQVW